MTITLYQFPISHYCEKVRWALDYKGLDYKIKNLVPGPHAAKTKKLAKRSSVPVLQHDDQVVQNSSRILTYLDEQFPDRPLTPVNDRLRSEAIEWERYCDQELGIHVRRYCYHTLLDHPDIVIPFFTHKGPWWSPLFIRVIYGKLQGLMRKGMDINEAGAQESYDHILAALDRISERLSGHEFLVGDHFTRADLTAAALVAPLIMPEEYGLKWPEKIPEPINSMVNANKERLRFAEDTYRQFRLSSATTC